MGTFLFWYVFEVLPVYSILWNNVLVTFFGILEKMNTVVAIETKFLCILLTWGAILCLQLIYKNSFSYTIHIFPIKTCTCLLYHYTIASYHGNGLLNFCQPLSVPWEWYIFWRSSSKTTTHQVFLVAFWWNFEKLTLLLL